MGHVTVGCRVGAGREVEGSRVSIVDKTEPEEGVEGGSCTGGEGSSEGRGTLVVPSGVASLTWPLTPGSPGRGTITYSIPFTVLDFLY